MSRILQTPFGDAERGFAILPEKVDICRTIEEYVNTVMKKTGYICSAETMIGAIREIGIVPFFRSPVPGWSIEDLTHPDSWFYSSDILGPWDWKIDAIHDGIVYGKYLSRRAAFATEEMYRHLMNWRRSLPQYQFAQGGMLKAGTIDQRLQKYLSPVLLSAIREKESLESSEIRSILDREVPLRIRKKVGGHMEKYLIPKVTRQAVDFLLGYLDMGTWTVIGDITRVYRGPNCEYKGWQRNAITTPDALFRIVESPSGNPFWTKFLEEAPESSGNPVSTGCSPEESRQVIIGHLAGLYPGQRRMFEKII